MLPINESLSSFNQLVKIIEVGLTKIGFFLAFVKNGSIPFVTPLVRHYWSGCTIVTYDMLSFSW